MVPIPDLIDRFAKHNPNPTSELKYASPFELLIATILSARATDKQVNVVTRKLFPIANTPHQLSQLPLETIEGAIQSIGFFRNKAKFLKNTSIDLLAHHNGVVPNTRTELEALPGVGRKVANVVLNILNDAPYMAVDTHVFRVSKRLGLVSQNASILKTEKELLQVLPQESIGRMHHWLVLHGRYICKSRQPNCNKCYLADICPSAVIKS